jgi:alkylated DNA repair dioxygenase AlkB
VTTPPAPELSIDRRATVRRLELDAASWVDLVEGFVRDPERELAELSAATPWAQQEVLRYDQYVPEQRLSAGLRADGTLLLRHADLHLNATYRVPFEGVAAILYRDGSDFQGLHSDRAMKWLDDTRIAIVVLGQRRPFVIRPRARWLDAVAQRVPAGEDPSDLVFTPGEGDMLVMGGACQRDWLHGVPASDTPNPRLSLTWRWSSRRGRPDTNPGYFDGRRFSSEDRRPGTRTRRSA